MVANDDKSIEELKHKLEKLAQGSWLQCFTKRFAWCNLAVYLLIYLLPIIPLWIIEYRAYIFLSGVRFVQAYGKHIFEIMFLYIILVMGLILAVIFKKLQKTKFLDNQVVNNVQLYYILIERQVYCNRLAFLLSFLLIPLIAYGINLLTYWFPMMKYPLRCYPMGLCLLNFGTLFLVDIIWFSLLGVYLDARVNIKWGIPFIATFAIWIIAAIIINPLSGVNTNYFDVLYNFNSFFAGIFYITFWIYFVTIRDKILSQYRGNQEESDNNGN